MRLKLLHGRNDPMQDMDGWGFVGPDIRGIAWIHGTYLTTITVGFTSLEEMRLAKEQTGWEEWDHCVLEVRLHSDMIEASGCFYGDFELENGGV